MNATRSEPWLILTNRYGNDVRDPSADDLAMALAEVYQENLAVVTNVGYAEHPNAWLRYGFDDGPMYVLDVYRNGRVVFGQWADQDYETELAPEIRIASVTEEHALELWLRLADGDVDRIRKEMSAAD